MNITHDFANWLEENNFGTLGTDIFIGATPKDAPDSCILVLSGGGNSQIKNKTGEKVKKYLITLIYRSTNAEEVYNTLQNIEETINENQITLLNYDTIEAECVGFPTDQDIDNEERTKGILQISLLIYK